MKNQNRKTFFMFLMAFLVASFIVSLVEVLRSSFTPSGAPEIQMAAAVSPFDSVKTPASFADLAEHVKPAVVNISTTKTFKNRKGLGMPFGRSPFGDDFFDRSNSVALVQDLSLAMMDTFLLIIMWWSRQTKY
jgi:serine protease Do